MRYYYMDAMRSVLMMLGIIIHSSQVYSPSQSWLVHSDTSHPAFSYGIAFIHSFRMPAFFIISGFFCLMMLQRQSVKAFIKTKFQRIFIPLLVTILTLNLLQFFILENADNHSFTYYNFLMSGGWLSHLWFLINLLVYFSLAATITYFFSGIIKKISPLTVLLDKTPIKLLLLLLPVFSIMIISLNKIGVPLYAIYFNAIDVYQIVAYLPYFTFGVLLFNSKTLLSKFSNVHFSSLLILLFVACLLQFVIHFDNNTLKGLTKVYSQSLIAWVSSSIIFKLFYLFANKPSNTWLFLSNSAYSVYLFHNIVVVSLALILVQYKVVPFTGFCILIIFTTAITLFIHRNIVLKFKIIQLLYNGKV